MLAETDEVPYECGPRQKYPMLFEEPIALQVNGIAGFKVLIFFK
jgi:E3 ubiquitin-protein ligase MYCBP2